jgi:Tfp pilus assembly protein PilF
LPTNHQNPQFDQSHPAPSPTAPKKENPFSATFRKATRSVTDALTIKPKVIPAKDPTSLSTKPGPVGPDLYLSAARLLESRGDVEAAVSQYEKALSIDAKHLPSLLSLGRLYHRQGRMNDAIRTCLRATQAHPKSAVAYNDLGLCYSRQSRVESAIKALSTAVQLEPESKLYRNNLAAALVQADRNDEALMQWTQVHGAAVAHYNLGYLLYKQGKEDAAHEQFKLALSRDAGLRQATQMLMRLKPAEAVVGSDRLPAAIAAPPAAPARTQPPVANQTLATPGPAAEPSADMSSRRRRTGAAAPQDMSDQPPAAPDSARSPVVNSLPPVENGTASPTPTAPIVRPEDARTSRFSEGSVRGGTPPDAFVPPPTQHGSPTSPVTDALPATEATSSPPPAPVVQPRDYRNRSVFQGQLPPTPPLSGAREGSPEQQEHLAPILTPEEAAARGLRQSLFPSEAQAETNRRDAPALPEPEGPTSPPGVVRRPQPAPPNTPQTLDRDSPFSPVAPPAAGYEPFSPGRETPPYFTPQPVGDQGPGADGEPAGVINLYEKGAAEFEPFSPRRQPPLSIAPRPSGDEKSGDEEEPAGVIHTSEPPALLRHRPPAPESRWQRDRGYVRLKSQDDSPTPEPRAPRDTSPAIRLPAIEMVEENQGLPAIPPLPPEQDARFGTATTEQPRELWPVRPGM